MLVWDNQKQTGSESRPVTPQQCPVEPFSSVVASQSVVFCAILVKRSNPQSSLPANVSAQQRKEKRALDSAGRWEMCRFGIINKGGKQAVSGMMSGIEIRSIDYSAGDADGASSSTYNQLCSNLLARGVSMLLDPKTRLSPWLQICSGSRVHKPFFCFAAFRGLDRFLRLPLFGPAFFS